MKRMASNSLLVKIDRNFKIHAFPQISTKALICLIIIWNWFTQFVIVIIAHYNQPDLQIDRKREL